MTGITFDRVIVMFKLFLSRCLAILFLLIAGGCAYLESRQGDWIFRPTETTWWGNREIPATFVEHTVPVGATGEFIHAWWAPVEDKNAPVMLYLHGARWNLSGSVTRIPRWNKMGFSVLAIDYRGFGKSSPRAPTEQSSYEDAEAAWAYIDTIAPHRKKFIFGHSLGGAMATHLALKDAGASGLILEATFTNISEMVKATPFGFLPVGGLITQRFDNLDRIVNVKVPILFAHGTDDTTVPFVMSEKLFAAATARKYFFKAEGGSHHNLTSRFYNEYASAVLTHFGLHPENVNSITTTSAPVKKKES
ncbi:MAG: alpha/beta fold hydrolase [Pseudomonadota bacterium]